MAELLEWAITPVVELREWGIIPAAELQVWEITSVAELQAWATILVEERLECEANRVARCRYDFLNLTPFMFFLLWISMYFRGPVVICKVVDKCIILHKKHIAVLTQ